MRPSVYFVLQFNREVFARIRLYQFLENDAIKMTYRCRANAAYY